MKNSNVYSIFTLVLSVVVLIGIVLSHLALTDIYHGIEPNLDTEWWIVRVTFIFVFVLAVTSVVFSLKMFRRAD
jgi:hypothetical protein